MRIPKARTYSRFWRVVCVLTRWRLYGWRCNGSAEALTWISTRFPKAESGYFRGGIQRQYCVRFRNHEGDCLSTITDRGIRTSRGVFFTPENPNETFKERVS